METKELLQRLRQRLRQNAYSHILPIKESRWIPAVLVPKRELRKIIALLEQKGGA